MEVKERNIYQPEFLNKTGERLNNEDSIFPLEPKCHSKLFMVCDGVGGQDKGEIASSITCDAFSKYIAQNPSKAMSRELFEDALSFTESKLKNHVTKNPDCQGMATTLTAIFISEIDESVHIVWVGDSRVYHIRDGKILFQSKDHSEVQSLIDMGEISIDEAKNHPRKNVILRAVNGSSHPAQLDYKVITDIQAGDFFFLCSDGMLENLNEEKINDWFKEEENPRNLKEKILKNALGKTKDNFSMYLIKIKEGKNPGAT